MSDEKICPVMSGFVTLPKGDSLVQKLVEVSCKKERCEWWDPHENCCVEATPVISRLKR